MNVIQFKIFLENVATFVQSGKLTDGQSLDDLYQKISLLDLDQKLMLKNHLATERSSIFSTDPVSYTHSVGCILQYGTEALKRAFIIGTLTGIANFGMTQEFSYSSAINKMLFTGALTFFASVSYDHATLPTIKLERIKALQHELGDVNLDAHRKAVFFQE